MLTLGADGPGARPTLFTLANIFHPGDAIGAQWDYAKAEAFHFAYEKVVGVRSDILVSGVEARSFKTFEALKKYLGSPGAGNEWHHIVEQRNIGQFGADMIQSTDNVVALPVSIHRGKGSISAYYSGPDAFTNGQTVRQWLSTQSFDEQRQFGIQKLKEFGY